MEKYYDPEYDRIVTEDVIMNQYNWFVHDAKSHGYEFPQTYEEFRDDNFMDKNTPMGPAFEVFKEGF